MLRDVVTLHNTEVCLHFRNRGACHIPVCIVFLYCLRRSYARQRREYWGLEFCVIFETKNSALMSPAFSTVPKTNHRASSPRRTFIWYARAHADAIKIYLRNKQKQNIEIVVMTTKGTYMIDHSYSRTLSSGEYHYVFYTRRRYRRSAWLLYDISVLFLPFEFIDIDLKQQRNFFWLKLEKRRDGENNYLAPVWIFSVFLLPFPVFRLLFSPRVYCLYLKSNF